MSRVTSSSHNVDESDAAMGFAGEEAEVASAASSSESSVVDDLMRDDDDDDDRAPEARMGGEELMVTEADADEVSMPLPPHRTLRTDSSGFARPPPPPPHPSRLRRPFVLSRPLVVPPPPFPSIRLHLPAPRVALPVAPVHDPTRTAEPAAAVPPPPPPPAVEAAAQAGRLPAANVPVRCLLPEVQSLSARGPTLKVVAVAGRGCPETDRRGRRAGVRKSSHSPNSSTRTTPASVSHSLA